MMQTVIFNQPPSRGQGNARVDQCLPCVLQHGSRDGGRDTSAVRKQRQTGDMSPAERTKLLLFLASFFGAVGFLLTLLCCGTEYWLLAAESCGRPEDRRASGADEMRVFHEGLFWRCSFVVASHEFSVWDLWISNQPPSKICQAAFLFPFPVKEPMRSQLDMRPPEPYEDPSAIVFRTFWSIFLVSGLASVVTGGFVLICAGSLANHRLIKAGGALQLCAGLCLLVVLLMYLVWIQVLDTLEQFVLRQSLSVCPSFHLSVHHGPSFLLAPVAVFFCLLSGLLFVLIGCIVRRDRKKDKIPEPETSV